MALKVFTFGVEALESTSSRPMD